MQASLSHPTPCSLQAGMGMRAADWKPESDGLDSGSVLVTLTGVLGLTFQGLEPELSIFTRGGRFPSQLITRALKRDKRHPCYL